jgi:exosortase
MKALATRSSWIPALLCAIAGAAVFQFLGNDTRGYIATDSLFRWWGHQWVNPESETQHGLIVLGLSACLLWRNLRRADSDGERWDGPALAGMAGGLALHALGYVAEQARISILGLLLFAWGVCALGGGSRWGRAAAFPLAFLVFAIPLNALDTAGFWLRMAVVNASSGLAHAAGVGVVRNGTQLLAPDGTYDYDVAAACSGVRSLTALAALSLLTGYIRFRPWGVRAGFLALSIPLVLVGNIARIAAIIFAAQAGGRVWGDRVHAVMGYGVFAIVLGGVFGAAELAARWRPEWEDDPGKGRADANEPVGGPVGTLGARTPPFNPAWIAGIVLGLAAAETGFLAHLAGRPEQGRAGVLLASDGRNPAALPTFLGTEWMGRQTEVTTAEREILPPDTGFSRKIYVSVADPSRQVLLSIVLSGRDRTSIHRPELCLVGQGWTIEGAFEHRFREAGAGGADLPATVLRVRREAATGRGRVAVPQLVAYWFMSGDAVVATHWERLKLDAWNRVVHGRADRWAYVLLQTGAADGEPAALARMQAILDGALTSFRPAAR